MSLDVLYVSVCSFLGVMYFVLVLFYVDAVFLFRCLFFFCVGFVASSSSCSVFFFQADDGIRALVRSRGLGDVYTRQLHHRNRPEFRIQTGGIGGHDGHLIDPRNRRRPGNRTGQGIDQHACGRGDTEGRTGGRMGSRDGGGGL